MRWMLSIVSTSILAVCSFSLIPGVAFAATNPAAEIANSANTSLNWSGYAATGGMFTSISGSWIVPTVSASTNAEADATWVGIGGISSKDLIQIGTQEMTQNGNVSYEAWYEILPATSVSIPLAIHPGDSVTASLTQNQSDAWQMTISDATTGQSFSTTISYDSSLSSAEWIEEMPSDQTGYIPLDNFGTVSFTNASAVKNGISVTPTQANAFPLTMITSAQQALSTPSPVGTSGADFTVTRSAAVATVAPHTVRLNGRGGFRRGGGSAVHTIPHLQTFSVRYIRLY